jgi:N-methylhydantoinase B/oxoprolinase/acetone carboxylase alpha subunit
MPFDPFTLTIIQEQLRAAADEMFVRLGQASKSPIIYEVLDYACALISPRGELISEAQGVPGFTGVLPFAVLSIVEKYGTAKMRPGDVYATNDPYLGGGTHLSDVCLIAPIMWAGDLVAFAANKAHWTEVGGMAAGSWTTDATEIYQEGLQLPAVKLFDAGRPVDSLIDLIAANVRLPDMTLSDLYAGVAALRVGQARVQEICRRYGLDAYRQSISAMLDHGQRIALERLAELPQGVYEAEDWIDDDGNLFVLTEPQAGGWGAGANRDGENGLVAQGDGETYNIPVEVCETRYPILVEQYALDVVPHGDGQYRGGRGLVRDYRILCHEALLTTTYGRHRFMPWGTAGGRAGSANGAAVIPAGAIDPVVWRGKLARYPLRRGDLARLITGTGGGYGDPFKRPIEMVQDDVKNGYVTLEQAERVYGVTLDPATLDVVSLLATRF